MLALYSKSSRVTYFLWGILSFPIYASEDLKELNSHIVRNKQCARRFAEFVAEPSTGLLARSHSIKSLAKWMADDAIHVGLQNSNESLALEHVDSGQQMSVATLAIRLAHKARPLCSTRTDLMRGFVQALIHMAPLGILSSLIILGMVAWVKLEPPTEEVESTRTGEEAISVEETISGDAAVDSRMTKKATNSSKRSDDCPAGLAPPIIEVADIDVPAVLRHLIVFGNAMVMLNFTIIMPTSHEVAHKGGASLGFSGLVIGIYGVGAISSLPFMVYWSKYNYRHALLFISVCVIFGNGLYALATASRTGSLRNAMLIVARLVCGWEGGIVLVFSSMINHCGKGKGVHDAYAQLVVGASAGLLLGPFLSSIINVINVALGNICLYPDVLPALLMIVYATIYGLACFLCCPQQEENLDHCASERFDDKSRDATSTVPRYRVREGYLFMLLTSNMIFARFCQRIAWESGALFIVAVEYDLGSTVAGLLIPLPLLGLLLLPLWSGRLFHRVGMLGYFQVTKVMEVVGLLLMIRLSGPTWFSLVQFMVGSSLFYMGNWGQAVPYGGCSIAFAIPNHWLLDLDIMNGLVWVFGFAGAFVGPVIIRTLLDTCMHQAMIPMTLAVLLLGFWVGQTAGFRLLAARNRL